MGFCSPLSMFTRATFHMPIGRAQSAKMTCNWLRPCSSKFKRSAFWTCFAGRAFKFGFKVGNPFFQFIDACWRILHALPYIPAPQKLSYLAEDSHV
jgi:hypothetical protein